jgi:hypothetical protein
VWDGFEGTGRIWRLDQSQLFPGDEIGVYMGYELGILHGYISFLGCGVVCVKAGGGSVNELCSG